MKYGPCVVYGRKGYEMDSYHFCIKSFRRNVWENYCVRKEKATQGVVWKTLFDPFRVVLPHLTQKHFSFLTLAIFFILHCHGNNKDNKTKTTRITYEDGDSSHLYNCLLRVKNPSLPTIVHYDVGPSKFSSGAHCTI